LEDHDRHKEFRQASDAEWAPWGERLALVRSNTNGNTLNGAVVFHQYIDTAGRVRHKSPGDFF
jgi:hypothetical protein